VDVSSLNWEVPQDYTLTRECGVTHFNVYGEFEMIIGMCGDEIIPSLPFNAVGSNVGMGDDFLVSGSQGADYAYTLTLAADATISVSLCSALTNYDTKLEIFTADMECMETSTGYYNDDATCEFGNLKSTISNAFLPAGSYYVVVDGFSGQTGNYEINIWNSGAVASEQPSIEEAMAYEFQKSGVLSEFGPWVTPEPVQYDREYVFLGSTTSLEFELNGIVEACFYVTADDMYPDANESAPSDEACVGPCVGLPGDVNMDGGVNVLDIVSMVGFILSGVGLDECQQMLADYNNDMAVNVLDIVGIVGYILGGGRLDNASSMSLHQNGHVVSMTADGDVAAIQMTLNHGDDFAIQLTDQALVAQYLTQGNSTTLIIVLPAGQELFTVTGDFEFGEVIAASQGGYIPVNTSTLPTEFALHNAYPNPFNPVTRLNLDVPVDSNANVTVYNLRGQVVEVLHSGSISAGYYTMTWNAASAPSGMYIIRADVAGKTFTQKVMLLK
jgi:hypothetical protein